MSAGVERETELSEMVSSFEALETFLKLHTLQIYSVACAPLSVLDCSGALLAF